MAAVAATTSAAAGVAFARTAAKEMRPVTRATTGMADMESCWAGMEERRVAERLEVVPTAARAVARAAARVAVKVGWEAKGGVVVAERRGPSRRRRADCAPCIRRGKTRQ